MRKRQVAAVYLMFLMGVWFPFACVLAGIKASAIGNFIIFVDEHEFDENIDKMWIRPVCRIVRWGWLSEGSAREGTILLDLLP